MADTLERMTVGKLKAILNTFPDNASIIMSCDAEGNRLHSMDEVSYEPTEEDGTKSLILWPEHQEVDIYVGELFI